MNGVDLIVDGGVRDKKQQAAFFDPFANSYVDAHLQTWSITPAPEHQECDVRHALGDPDRRRLLRRDLPPGTAAHSRALPPIHTYDLTQQTLAGYWQQTIGLLPTTDFSYGGRIQNTSLSAQGSSQRSARCAMFFTCGAQALPLDSSETQYALHVGGEHRFNNVFSVFGRAARAFRTPNVDERVSSGPAFDRLLQLRSPATSR